MESETFERRGARPHRGRGPESPPTACDSSHIGLSYVAPFYFNQDDGASLQQLLRAYTSYPAALLDRIQFVFVDDGSPTVVSIPADLDLNLLVLRVTVDIPWNQPGARNLGVVAARSDKLLLTDLDHIVPASTLEAVLAMRNPDRTIFKLHRVRTDGSKWKPHPNTFVLSRGRFLALYGYDEEFCGSYGYEDPMFWRWQRYHGTRFRYLARRYPVILRDLDTSRSYHSLARDKTRNAELYSRKRSEIATFGPRAGHSRRFLCFPWTVVLDRQRQSRPPEPPPNRLWKQLWWWRWLVGGHAI